jgi:hypothetical protein
VIAGELRETRCFRARNDNAILTQHGEDFFGRRVIPECDVGTMVEPRRIPWQPSLAKCNQPRSAPRRLITESDRFGEARFQVKEDRAALNDGNANEIRHKSARRGKRNLSVGLLSSH